MGLVRSTAARLNRWRSRFSPSRSPAKPEHLALGERGEKLAARFLRGQGFKVLYRNFRAKHGGEVDLVCRDADTLVFVEVKTRTRSDFGRPSEAVNRDKQFLITRGALAWLRLLDNPEILFRFDIVEVLVTDGRPELTLLRDAFHLPEPYIY